MQKEVLETTPDNAGRTIGKDGRNRRKLEDNYNIHLIAHRSTLIIRGKPQDVKAAQEEIRQQIKDYHRRIRQYNERRQSSPQ